MVLLLVGVLAAAVGAAWLVQAPPARRTRAARQILEQLRRDGLARHWPETLRIHWYLMRQAKQPLAWMAVVTGRTEDGGFAGMKLDLRELEKFVSETIPLDDVEAAFEKMHKGEVLRSVVVL